MIEGVTIWINKNLSQKEVTRLYRQRVPKKTVLSTVVKLLLDTLGPEVAHIGRKFRSRK